MTVTTWRTDPAHTDIQFSAKHMMVTTVRGKFADVDGSLTLDEADPTASSGSFTVRAASLTTGNEQRDGHLRSADFFDAETYPEITFVSTAVTPQGRQRLRGHRRPHDPRHHPAGHVRRRVPRPLPGLRGPARRVPCHDEAQPRGLGPDLERHARDRRLARRQGDQARDRPRARRGRRTGRRGGRCRARARNRGGCSPPPPDARHRRSPGRPDRTTPRPGRFHARRPAIASGARPPPEVTMPPFDVDALRARFPALALEHEGRPMAFFDGPGGTQVTDTVIEAVSDYYRESNANHGGTFPTSERSRRDPRRGPRRARRPAQRGEPGRDQARREHDDAHDARRALDHGGHAAGRRDRRHGPRPRGERRAVAGRRRGPRAHGPDGRDPAGRRHARPRGVRRDPPRPAEARRVRLGVERGRHDQPGRRARPPGPRGGRADLRRRGARRAAPADRRPGDRDGLPRLLGLQVLRAARRGPVRAGRGRSTRCRRTSCGRPTTGSRPGRSTTRGSPGRSPRSSTSPRWASATAAPYAAALRRHDRAAGSTRTRGWPRSAPTRWPLFERLLDGLDVDPRRSRVGHHRPGPLRRAHADRGRSRFDGITAEAVAVALGAPGDRDLVGQLLRRRGHRAAGPRARGRAPDRADPLQHRRGGRPARRRAARRSPPAAG